MSPKRFRIYVLGVCLFCLPQLGWPQGNRGVITGTVLDLSQAVVPAVAVTITDTSRGLKYTVTSTGAGNFTVPDLTVG